LTAAGFKPQTKKQKIKDFRSEAFQTEDKVHGLSVDFSLLNVCKPAQTLRFVV
jgi:hypothetical protein